MSLTPAVITLTLPKAGKVVRGVLLLTGPAAFLLKEDRPRAVGAGRLPSCDAGVTGDVIKALPLSKTGDETSLSAMITDVCQATMYTTNVSCASTNDGSVEEEEGFSVCVRTPASDRHHVDMPRRA